MGSLQSAVLFMEETENPTQNKPLMLETVCSCPILAWMSSQLLVEGVQRFFVVCEPELKDEVRKCFPEGADVTVSNLQSDLFKFLNTPDSVLVLNRSAVPMAEAGLGFAYEASGYELQEAWKTRMTNAVQGASLVGGWLPVFGPDTISELEPLMRGKEIPAFYKQK